MVGTVDVAEGTGSEASGVDFTEYTLDGGAPVRLENDEDEDPFENTFTVSTVGDHVVEYSSTDNAGNEEAIKSVEFSIAEADPGRSDGPRASPTRRRARRRCSCSSRPRAGIRRTAG